MREIKHERNIRNIRKVIAKILLPMLPIVILFAVIIAVVMQFPKNQPEIKIISSTKEEIIKSTGGSAVELYDHFGNIIKRPIHSEVVNDKVTIDGKYDTSLDLMCTRIISETEINKVIESLMNEKGIIDADKSIYPGCGFAFILASNKTGLDPIFILVLTELLYYNMGTTRDDIVAINDITLGDLTPEQKFAVLVERIATDFKYRYYDTDIARSVFDIGLITEYTAMVPSIRYLMETDMQKSYDILNNGGM
jgi:hypothetical protein